MLKQSHINNYQDQHHLNLYDKVRQDLFEEDQKPKELRAPSITTIFLLQIQAYIVQLLLQLPPIHHNNNNANTALSSQRRSSSALFFVVIYQQKRLHVITSIRSIIRQCLRWVLLVGLLILDNIARVLNVEGEMYEITNKQQKEEKKPIHNSNAGFEEEDYQVHDDDEFVRSSTDTYRDDYYLQKKSSFNHGHSDQCTTTNNNKRNTNGIPSEPSSPTHPKKLNGGANYSPSHSPTPNFIRNSSRPTSAVIQQKEFSPNLNPSRVNNRTRSLSNNLDQYTAATKQQKLRRITGQREITLQNAILPIPSRNSNNSSKPPLGNIVKKANSVASRSSSESISGGGVVRPKMQKTQSLSTAQQYHSHNHNHHHHHHHNESFKLDLRSPMIVDTKKPYERCCPACAST